jgi:hypothetical protein
VPRASGVKLRQSAPWGSNITARASSYQRTTELARDFYAYKSTAADRKLTAAVRAHPTTATLCQLTNPQVAVQVLQTQPHEPQGAPCRAQIYYSGPDLNKFKAIANFLAGEESHYELGMVSQ